MVERMAKKRQHVSQLALQIENQVVWYYLESRDYNGLPLANLARDLETNVTDILPEVIALVRDRRISMPSPYQTNPFIKAFDAPIEEQLLNVNKRDPSLVCLYPTPFSIRDEINPDIYRDSPFTRAMILGRPQLVAVPFRIDILDFYERDPRYWFRFHDFGGTISVHDEYWDRMEESDRADIKFGVGYDENEDRVVAVYAYDMASLPGKHQRIWKEYLLDGPCRMSEEFKQTTLLAEFPETISVYQALIYEQVEINKLFTMMGRDSLFRNTYSGDSRPRQFSFFIRPTQENYDNFVQLLDKMLSDNIRIDSFGKDVTRQKRIEANAGEFELRNKGSISMLNEWLTLRYPKLSLTDKSDIIGPLREVRKLRQPPAHKIIENTYDKRFYSLQDELVWKVYKALKKLRNTLMTDPDTVGYEPPSWYESLTVKSY